MDFCAKNIMLDATGNRIFFIDVDSSWPAVLLTIRKPRAAEGQIAFWGLWNESISKVLPVRLGNAQKSILLSFAAVWSRAVALKRGVKKGDYLAALTLVHNPSFDRQRPLWEALGAANKQGFFEYFRLKGVKAVPVYVQWQEAFNALRRGKELAWQEIVTATENLLAAIGGTGKRKSKPRGKGSTVKRSSKNGKVLDWSVIAEAEAEDVKRHISEDLTFEDLLRWLSEDELNRLEEIIDAYPDLLPAKLKKEVKEILDSGFREWLFATVPRRKLINVLRYYGAKI